MKRRKFVFGVIAAVLIVAAVGTIARIWLRKPVPEGAPTARPEGAGWVDLLDAAHAPGWKNITDTKDLFEIKDGVLHIYGRMIPPLRYVGYAAEKFGDFDLHVEFKVSRRANSGVFLRAQPKDPVYRGFEIQVLDDYGRPPTKNTCGAIYDVVTPMFNMSRPTGEWNSFDISLRGKEIKVSMNGWMIIHTDFSKMTKPLGKFKVPFTTLPLEGILALQDHGGEVWYRNILIRKI